MKQAMGCDAGTVGQNMLRDLNIYLQAFWHLGSRYVARNIGLSGNGKKRCQARYERSGNAVSVRATTVQQPPEAPCNKSMMLSLPNGALTEIRSFSGVGESRPAAEQSLSAQRVTECSARFSHNKWQQELGQILPALAGFCQQRWLVLLAPPCVPSEEELTAAGIDPSRVLLVHTTNANGFNVLQQALRSGTCGAVLAWLESSDEKPLEQLRQAAEAGNAWGVLFRAPKHNQNAQLEMSIT